MLKFVAFCFGIALPMLSFSQSLQNQSSVASQKDAHNKFPVYFGIQARPVFPLGFIEPTNYSIGKNGIETRIAQKNALAFGGVLRMQLTDLFGIETGIHLIHRSFDLEASIPDSSISISGDMTFIEYEIPISGLVSVKLSDNIFMTSSMGPSISFTPTDAHHFTHLNKRHYFLFYAKRKGAIGFGLNTNIGFEYRTEKSGFFYFGGSARIPFRPLFEYELMHEYDVNVTSVFADIEGAFLSLDLRYFLPVVENKGKQFRRGPIE